MRRLLLALVLATLVGPAAAGAAPRPRLQLVGLAAGPVHADGQRFVAYQVASGDARVIDTQRGTSFVVPRPVAPQPYLRWELADVGGGQLLWTCQCGIGPVSDALLVDLVTRAPHVPAGLAVFQQHGPDDPYFDFVGWGRVGRRWLAGGLSGYHVVHELQYDWQTGERRDLESLAPEVLAELDSPTGTTPLCSPLRQVAELRDNPEGLSYLAFAYEPPYAVRQGRGGLELLRCGHQAVRKLERCPETDPCADLQLVGGLATWGFDGRRGPSRVAAYDVRRGTAYRWTLPRPSPSVSVGQTRRRLWVSYYRGGRKGSEWVLRSARRP